MERKVSDQVENNRNNSENNFKELIQQDFKEKVLNSMKENLIFSLISFLFARVIESEIDKKNFQKDFISFWKKGMSEITQKQLENINNLLNENNVDLINLIKGSNNFADIEDYQQIINESIRDVENIFWKICGEDLK